MNSYNFFLIFLFYFFLEIFEGFFFIQNAQSGVCPDQVIAHPHLVGPEKMKIRYLLMHLH